MNLTLPTVILWSILPNDSQILAVHAALVHTVQIIYCGGDENELNKRTSSKSDTICPPSITLAYHTCSYRPGFADDRHLLL